MGHKTMRKMHVVQVTGKLPSPQSVVVVQAKVRQHYLSESDDVGELRLESWYACYGTSATLGVEWGDESQGTTAPQFWRWLDHVTGGHKEARIYSWQASEVMAALGLWDKLADETYTLKGADPYDSGRHDAPHGVNNNGFIVLEGPPTIVAFARQHSGTRLVWLDPQNYGIKALDAYTYAEYADGANGPRLDGELWIEGSGTQTVAYAVCEWLQSYLMAVDGLDLGGPAHTAASQAMQAFRYHYMRDRIEIHDSVDVCRWERDALYGGRCECNYIGSVHSGPTQDDVALEPNANAAVRYNQGPLYHLDVNSLYAHVASKWSVPIKLKGVCGNTNIYDLLAACKSCGVIAVCQVKTDVPCVPVRIDENIYYPVGTFPAVLCGPEIMLASAAGARIKCRRMALYQVAPIYAGFVERLYRARCEYRRDGNARMEQVVKAILNAAFGKWAQVGRKWEDVPNALPLRPYMQWWQREANGKAVQYRSIGWNVQRMVTRTEEGNETFPAITAYIMSLGRVYLWELLQVAGMSNVYYMDTDSLICNRYAYENLQTRGMLDQEAIGKLKVVSTPSNVRIIGRQAYEQDGRLTISGARGSMRKHGDAYVEVLTAPPMGYYLRHSDPPGLERRITRVKVTREYQYGEVSPDGTVKPYRFGNDKP